ncbi:MAG: cytochrome c [Nitrosomonas sp.]|nr:cytochrome c [Nitrosomonas sp.]
MAKFNDLPNNGHISNAPASYPFLWGTHQSDVVQWTGFAPNGPDSIGALIRNGGEVLGVYGQLNILDDKSIKHYKSSIDIENLGKLESWVAELRSPIWPSEYLPAINVELAANGQRHYDKYCAACHEVIARKDQGKKYKAVLTPLADVGTDPQEIINLGILRPSGKFLDRKEAVIIGDKIQAQTTGLDPLVNAVVGSLLQQPKKALEAAIIEFEGGVTALTSNDGINEETPDNIPLKLKADIAEFSKMRHHHSTAKDTASTSDDGAVYKARPLTGIWATAPYLHNGSVLNLYELLRSADQRSEKFYLGSREFDPVKVGLVSTSDIPDAIAFEFDTRLVGNSNSGHEYGVNDLSEHEKDELLEYLKTL